MIAQQLDAPGEATMLDVNHWLHMEAFADPTFELALVSLFLDPFWRQLEDLRDDDYMGMEDEPLPAALEMARRHYPEHYAEFGEQYWLLPYDEFESYVHDTLMQYMPTTHTIVGNRPEALHYQWVPIELYGIDFLHFDEHMETFELPQMKEFLMMFDLNESDYGSLEDNCQDAWVRDKSIDMLGESLIKQECGIFDNIMMLIKWLWNRTGNTMMDYDHENFSEMGMYDFATWDNVEQVRIVQEEADELIQMAIAGIDTLIANPMLLHSLRSNYETVYRSIMAEKLEYNENNIKIKRLSEWKLDVNTTFELQWARPYTASGEGFTDAQRDLRILRLWRDDANTKFVLRRRSNEGI